MRRSSATAAIVTTRLSRERILFAVAVAACALLAYLQRYDDGSARLAGCLVFGTLAGVPAALLQRGAGRARELELCEQSAPLYGRELARATAVVPCIVVTAAICAYFAVSALYVPIDASTIVLTLCAVYAAVVTALCAGVRTGAARLLYVAMSYAIPAAAFVLWLRWGPAFPSGICAAAGFVALRQYGEALARYEPV